MSKFVQKLFLSLPLLSIKTKKKDWRNDGMNKRLLFNFQVATRASIIRAVNSTNARKRDSMLLTVPGVPTTVPVPVGSASPLAAPLEKLIDTVDELVD